MHEKTPVPTCSGFFSFLPTKFFIFTLSVFLFLSYSLYILEHWNKAKKNKVNSQ